MGNDGNTIASIQARLLTEWAEDDDIMAAALANAAAIDEENRAAS